jgi:hypothetical protein
MPPHAGMLDSLTPYAVLLRYDFGTTSALNRVQTDALLADVRGWAGGLIR